MEHQFFSDLFVFLCIAPRRQKTRGYVYVYLNLYRYDLHAGYLPSVIHCSHVSLLEGQLDPFRRVSSTKDEDSDM